MEINSRTFFGQFAFRSNMAGFMGVEREWFLFQGTQVVPLAELFLRYTAGDRFTFELSACQIETRTLPCPNQKLLLAELHRDVREGNRIAKKIRARLEAVEVAPEDMPLTIFPNRRYMTQVIPKLSDAQILAACRVAGTHIHVGCSSMEEAIVLRNRLLCHSEQLCVMGDASNGERLSLYKQVVCDSNTTPYESPMDYYADAIARGFANNPRNCWDMIRISRHGTVEIRTFGTTSDAEKVLEWAAYIRNIYEEIRK